MTAGRNLARAAESARINTETALRGWVIIGVVTLVLSLLFLFAVQKATELPTYDVLGLDACDASQTDADRQACNARKARYTSTERGGARAVIVVVMLLIVYGFYRIYAQGVAVGFVGGDAAKNSLALQTQMARRAEVVRAQARTDAPLSGVSQSRAAIPAGTADPIMFAPQRTTLPSGMPTSVPTQGVPTQGVPIAATASSSTAAQKAARAVREMGMGAWASTAGGNAASVEGLLPPMTG